MNIGGDNSLAFFVGSEENAIGGMETHAKYFIGFFQNCGLLKCVVFRNQIRNCITNERYAYEASDELFQILEFFGVKIMFFNDGHWVEKFDEIRHRYPNLIMIMRSGGNEFMKASVMDMSLPISNRRKIWADSINQIDYIISNSAYSTHRMLNIGIKKEKIVLARGGVDIRKCMKYSENKEQLRRELSIRYQVDQISCFIGIVSRFEKFKGIEQTIEVLSNHQDINWHLFLAGIGAEEKYIREKLNSCLDSSKYTVLGKLDNRQSLKLISSLDFLLNMSLEYVRESGSDTYIHTETMGRSMIEAICCKTPIIASHVGGIAELFHEQPSIGYMLEDFEQFNNRIGKIFTQKVTVQGKNIEKYDWSYLFENVYMNLMNIQTKKAHKINLVIDLEGSIIHDFLNDEINKKNFEQILRLSDRCNVIINTAGELTGIFEHYPYVADYLERIIIIANCGRKVLIYGERFHFWEKYYESLYGPSEKMVNGIKEFIERKGYKVTKISEVDKLYINFKACNICEETILELNDLLRDTAFHVCKNDNNIKLISEEIEKGNTLRFICSHILKTERSFGVGNGVLDMFFLNLCEKAYYINHMDNHSHYTHIEIKNSLDMEDFIGIIVNEITEESTYCYS